MKEPESDRRSRRSRRLIADALFALMLEKRYDRITVQEILDRADVGRSTFYAHYRGKEDVLLQGFEQVLRSLHEQLLISESSAVGQLLPSLGLFQHVAEMQPMCHAMVRGSGVDLHSQAVHRYLRELVERRLASLLAAGYTLTAPAEILADYLAGAYFSLLRWWLDHELPYSPEQMDAIFQQLALPGVQQVLQQGSEDSAIGARHASS